MNEKRMKEALEAIARRDVPEKINLWPRLEARLEQRRSWMQTLRARPVMTFVIVLLALSLLTGVVYAIGRSLGYIPGVGLVENSQTVRILAEKVSAKNNGITLTVSRLTADSSQTILEYRITGIPFQADANHQKCEEAPVLRLPDGATLTTSSPVGVMGGENGILTVDARLIYPALPPDVSEVTLLPPCELPSVTLNLIPAPAGLIQPVTEIPATFEASHPALPGATPSSAAIMPLYPTDFPATPTPVPHGSGLYLEKVVETDNSYLLMGNFTNTSDLVLPSVGDVAPYEFRMTDRDGQGVRFSIRPDLMPASAWPNVTYWAVEVYKPVLTPITITLPAVSAQQEGNLRLSVDVGQSPAVGQTWVLQQTVQVGSHSFLVESVTRSERGYTLRLRSLTPISTEDFFCYFNLEEKMASLLSEQVYDHDGFVERTETLVFDDAPPVGRLTFVLTIFVQEPLGPWTLTWSPPAGP